MPDGFPDLILLVLLFGLGLGIVIAFIASCLTDQFGQPRNAESANLVLFFTLAGCFLGLLLSVLVLIARTKYLDYVQTLIELNLIQVMLDWSILVLPSLGAIVGAIAYWRLFRVHRG